MNAVPNRVLRKPNSLGPNIRLIGSISATGLEQWEVNGRTANGESRTGEPDNDWLSRLAASLVAKGITLRNVVLICDTSLVNMRIGPRIEELGLTWLQQLQTYSPMLNPLEAAWTIVKARVKTANFTVGKGEKQQRVQYMEDIILQTLPEITPLLCSRAVENFKQFTGRVLQMEDMPVGDYL